MEAVGLIASIVQLIEALSTTISYINAVKDASKEKTNLLVEISELTTTLTRLQLKYDDSKAQSAHSWLMGIQSLDEPLKRCKEMIQEIQQKIRGPKGVKKVLANLKWPLDKKETIAYINGIERMKSLISIALQEDIRELVLAIKNDTQSLSTLSSKVDDITDTLASLKTRNDLKLKRKTVEWLSPLNFLTAQEENFALSQSGTCQWFLDDPKFQNWVSEEGEILWAPGIPGAGKTVLTSIITDRLRLDLQSALDTRVAVAYCSYRDQQTQSCPNILAGLWRQIIKPSEMLSNDVQELYDRYEALKRRPTPEAVLDVLKKEMKNHKRCYFVVDALDELSESTREDLIKTLKSLEPVPNLLITSRNMESIASLFLGHPTVPVCARGKDIAALVETRILQEPRLMKVVSRRPELRERTINVILQRSQNMFLLPKLYLDNLATQTSIKKYQQTLESLPLGLEATYDAALQRIQETDDSELALKALYWVSSTLRPLSLSELLHALAVDPDTTQFDEDDLPLIDITSLCAGLIEINPLSEIVRLSHYTTLDYLKGRENLLFPKCSSKIALTCLTYLFCCEHSTELTSYTLLSYATLNWGRHYTMQSQPDGETEAKALAYLRLESRKSDFLVAHQHHKSTHPSIRRISGFHLAAYFDLSDLTKQLCSLESYDTAVQESTYSPLDWAAALGRNDIVQTFIDAGANVSNSGRHPRKAIHLASAGGHEGAVQLLLENGGDVNLRVLPDHTGEFEESCPWGQTPLHEAACWNQVRVAEVLVERGADVNVRLNHSAHPETPLDWTIKFQRPGYAQMVKLLLENGAKPIGKALMFNMVQANSPELVQLFIDHGTDLNQPCLWVKKALDYSLELRNKDIVHLLLQNGALPGLPWNVQSKAIKKYRNEIWFDTLATTLAKTCIQPKKKSCCFSYRRSDYKVFNQHSFNVPYLEIIIPPDIIMPIQRIVIGTESHDQGWSDFRDEHGTYCHSQSWFELAVTASSQPCPGQGIRFQDNIHASLKWKTHMNIFDRQTASDDDLLWINRLQTGMALQIFARAFYQGWENHVRLVKVDIFGSGNEKT